MKPLTFVGFLKRYVQELSSQKTANVRKLAKDAVDKSPRLRAPLLLFLFLTHSPDSSERLLHGFAKLSLQYRCLEKYGSPEQLLISLENKTADLPEEFLKAYRSYCSVRDRSANEQRTKALMRQRILKLQVEKQVTDYRLYTALHLNAGNFSAFMRQQKLDRLSLDKARQMLFFLESHDTTSDLSVK